MSNSPNFSDYEFVNAALLNTAFGYVNSSRQDLLSNGFTAGLFNPANITFSPSNLVVTVTFANTGVDQPRVLFGSGVLAGGYGTTSGSVTNTYAVNLAPYVPVSGSQTVYVVATAAQIGQNSVTISGPPPGHPDYSPTYVPTTAYTETVDTVAVSATLAVPDNAVSIELCRVVLSAGQSAIASVNTAYQIYAGAQVGENAYLPGSPTTTTQATTDSSTKIATTAFVNAYAYVKGSVANNAPIATGNSGGPYVSATTSTYTAPSNGNLFILVLGENSANNARTTGISTTLTGCVTLQANASGYLFTAAAYLPMLAGQSTTITGYVNGASGSSSMNLYAFFLPGG